MKNFNLKGYEQSIKTSRMVKQSLIGEDKEVIPIEEWDLGEESPLLHPIKEHFYHPHTERMFDYVMNTFTPSHKIALFTNCTAKKPYSSTLTYKRIIGATSPYENIYDLITISSIGIIPAQFEKYYPFSHYAWDDNHSTKAEVKEVFHEVIGKRVKEFLEKFNYDYIIGVFRVTSKGKKALRFACDILNKPLIEIPSAISFEKMQDNCVKMNTFQLTNNDTLGELNNVLKMLSEGVHVEARQSWTSNKVHDVVSARMKMRRQQRLDLKNQGYSSEEIDEILYTKK
ncbi:MAG: DUF5591 domain-containing protein [Methanogenium sp.]